MSSIIIAWSLELVAKELEAYTLNVTLPIVLPFGALLTREPMAWALRPTLPHRFTAQVCGCYAVATFKRLPKFSTTLASDSRGQRAILAGINLDPRSKITTAYTF